MYTCKQHLVSGYSLYNIQHVPCQRETGTLGLGFKLMQHLSKQRVPLSTFFQCLKSLVKLTDVLCIKLQYIEEEEMRNGE